MIAQLLQDLKYAMRQLRAHPGFTITATVTLALGIGVNAAMFSVIDQVLLRPLPYADPSRLVAIRQIAPDGSSGPVSLPDIKDWEARSHSFSSIAYYTEQAPTLGGIDNPQLEAQIVVSTNLLHTLGVQPALGRNFQPEEAQAGKTNVVLLSASLWRKFFHSDPHVVGRPVSIDGSPYTVIGVMPQGFTFPTSGDADILITPIPTDDKNLQDRSSAVLTGLGRLKPGVTTAQAAKEMNGIKRQLVHEYPKDERPDHVQIEPYRQVLTDNVRPGLWALDGAVLAVWLIACVNVAGLMLTRMSGRRREIAIRGALGAGPARLLRQFLTESLLLSIAGGAAGLAIAIATLRLLRHYLADAVPRGASIHVDTAVCIYLLIASCISALIFGIVPAWHGAHVPAQEGLKEGSTAAGASRQQRRFRDTLVVTEIALSLVLLIAAGLMGRSLYALRHARLGFVAENVVTAAIIIPQHSWFFTDDASKSPSVVSTFYRPLLERIKRLPGVEYAGVSTVRPLNPHWAFTLEIELIGHPSLDKARPHNAAARAATDDYFRALGIRLIRGRYFNSEDSPSAPLAVIVNQAFVRRYFPNQDPLGQRLKAGDKGPHAAATIVGVVDDSRQTSASVPAQPEVDFNLTQMAPADDLYPILTAFHADLAVRSRQAPSSLVSAVRQTVHDLDPNIALGNVESMQQVVDDSMGNQVLAARLLAVFSLAALAIALAGIYGLLAYSVSQRTRELGLRMALGAQRSHVLWLVFARAIGLLGAGVVLGLMGALFMGKVVGSFLYGVHAHDAFTIIAVSVILCLCGLAASYFPARRAASINPVEALRSE